jgi:2-hydroxychromene-2-carboxylate isomerase
VVPEWEPVVGSSVGVVSEEVDRASVERAAAALGLQPVRWPSSWPPDVRAATLAATYAKRVGRVVGFSLALFRQQFAGGRDISAQDTVLIAAAACEMHPTALLKGVGLRSVNQALATANARAARAGVRSLPAIEVEGRIFTGDGLLGRAAEVLGEVGAA